MARQPDPVAQPAPSNETLGVSRETGERLRLFADLLVRWNPRINLISPGDVPHVWTRHIADSLQILPLLPPDTEWGIDLGSGGGFPGLVLAIAGMKMALIESDQRKCAFLREAARITGAPASVYPTRIEAANLPPAPLITARALAPLDKLLDLATSLATPDATFVFLKGQAVEDELTLARRRWQMRVERFPSSTAPTSCLLRIRDAQLIPKKT